jgi:hypothetical protein
MSKQWKHAARAAALSVCALLSSAPAYAQSSDCLKQAVRNMSISTHEDDEFTRVKWETRQCKGTLEITGKARIAGDLSGFESISQGGKVIIDARDDDHRRELTLTPSNGRFAYQYEVDGERRSWDEAGKAWLSSVITLLVRRGGFGADERVDYLLRTGGVNGVLQEVALLESDHTQRVYLNKLLSKTTLNGGAVQSVINVAQRELQSDYELTEFLIAVARRYDFTEESRAAFISASNTLDSDYEHRRALSAVLSKGGLSSDDVVAVLKSAGSIGSDYEKAELLIGIADRYALDQRMRTSYLYATGNMTSDYEKGRVFKALLKENNLAATDVAYVLEATAAVGSDYERGQILKMVAGKLDFSQPQLQQAYAKASAELGSDYEKRQVLSELLKRERLTPAALDVVLQAAAPIGSDYERTELLMQVVRNHTLSSAQKARVIKMAEEIRSDHDRGRISSLLLRQMNN